MSKNIDGKVIVITGASSGVGEASARLLSSQVVLGARRAERIQALAAHSPLDRLKVDDWEQMIDVNLKGVLYGIAAVLPHMKTQKSGHHQYLFRRRP